MRKKIFITLLMISMICLYACGKADNTEDVVSSAIETDQQEVVEAENIMEDEPVQEDEEADTVETKDSEREIETDIESVEEEAQELFAEYESELDCNEESFKENYAEERINGSTKEDAFKIVYEMFKKVEEQPAEQQSTTKQSEVQQSQQSNVQQTKQPVEEGSQVDYIPDSSVPGGQRPTSGFGSTETFFEGYGSDYGGLENIQAE